MKRFRINIALSHVLSTNDLWPDGDAPDEPTVHDVRELVDRETTLGWLIEEWGLGDLDDVEISEVRP